MRGAQHANPHTLEIRLKLAQMKVFTCEKRFRVLVAGRRFGKTYLALLELLRAACAPNRMVWYVAPTYKQGKRMAWNRLKQLTRPYWASRPNETDLNITLKWGSVIALRGADQYDSLRGEGLDFVVLDEYASMHPACWTEVLRPALSDRVGGALFIGTPQGFNHFYDRYDRAQMEADWAAFQFTTEQGGNVSTEELANAARELDERCYRQEFQASFENLGQGRAYYAFERSGNVLECRYRPGVPLIWSVDFNVNPMCSIPLRNGWEKWSMFWRKWFFRIPTRRRLARRFCIEPNICGKQSRSRYRSTAMRRETAGTRLLRAPTGRSFATSST